MPYERLKKQKSPLPPPFYQDAIEKKNAFLLKY